MTEILASYSALQIALLTAFLGVLIAASVQDAMMRKISNVASVSIALLGFAFHIASYSAFTDILIPLASGAVVFVLGVALFARGLLGGGDVKLLASCAIWTAWPDTLGFLMITALIGGAMAILWRFEAPVRFALANAGMKVDVAATQQMPYGIAIAGGAFLTLFPIFLL